MLFTCIIFMPRIGEPNLVYTVWTNVFNKIFTSLTTRYIVTDFVEYCVDFLMTITIYMLCFDYKHVKCWLDMSAFN